MGDWALDTEVEGSGGHYRARLSPDWDVWGPMGGYRAAIALRAIGLESHLARPASFSCQFLGVGKFDAVELEVTTLRASKRAEAKQVVMTQEGRALLTASAWVIDRGMQGYEHDVSRMPAVPAPEELRGFQELADNYADWYPFWRNVEARPVVWSEEKRPPIWQTWFRFLRTPPLHEPFLEAARSLLCLDLMMWNALLPLHGYPPTYLAPNLDLTAQFHRSAPEEEWLLCDSYSPMAGEGLAGCSGRVWAPDGRLLASGTSQLLCRPNPTL